MSALTFRWSRARKNRPATNQQIAGQAPISQITGHAHISSEMIATLSGPEIQNRRRLHQKLRRSRQASRQSGAGLLKQKSLAIKNWKQCSTRWVPNGERTTSRQRGNQLSGKRSPLAVREKALGRVAKVASQRGRRGQSDRGSHWAGL